jgi:hypothetical protein
MEFTEFADAVTEAVTQESPEFEARLRRAQLLKQVEYTIGGGVLRLPLREAHGIIADIDGDDDGNKTG